MAQPIGKGKAGGQIPQQRAGDLSATTRALSNLGEAIAQTGQLAERMQEEKERQQLGQAELQFAQAEGALQAKLARTPDPGKHEQIARQHFEEAKAKILNNDAYTNKFRNDLSDRLNMAGATRLNKIQTNAALQQVRNGRQINNERIKNRLADNDFSGAAELINGSIGVYLTPEMGQVQLEEVGMRQEDHAKKQIKEDALNEIAGDPMGWAKRNAEPWEGDMAGDWVTLQSHAKTVRRNKGYEETDNVLDLIYSDQLTDPDKIEQMTPHLRPKAREGLRTEYEKRQEYLAEGIHASSVDQDTLIGKVGELLSVYEADGVEDYDHVYAHIDSLVRDIKDPSVKAEYGRMLKAKRAGQWAESKEKKDLAIKSFNDAIETSEILLPEPPAEEEQSLGSYLDDEFLSDQDRLRAFGFNEDDAEEIAKASEAWYGEGETTGADPVKLLKRLWSNSVKADDDFDKKRPGERAIFNAIRHYKSDAYTITDEVAAGRAEEAERRREVENTKRKGILRKEYIKFLDENPDATPQEIQQKAHDLGVNFTVDSIKSKFMQQQEDRNASSLGTGDIFRVASSYLNVREIEGAKNQPTIMKWLKRIDPKVVSDQTAWCSAFAAAVVDEAGFEGSESLLAKSWENVGDPINLSKAQKGDVVVFWRGEESTWKGHVGFYQGLDSKGDIRVLGGNQGNRVTVSTYPKNRLLSVRRLRPKSITQ